MHNNVESDAAKLNQARRSALLKIGAYAALTPPVMVGLLSATKSAAFAGSGCTRQNPGNTKCVGNAPFDGTLGQEPSGKPKDETPGPWN